jgi:hypothetical protein
MTPVICPFCGMASDIAHDTQAACIEALRAEVARTRQILEHVTEPLRAPVISADDEAHVT